MSDPGHKYQEKVQEALAPVFGDEMVTKWVLIAEVMDSDGERAVYALSQPDSRVWDTLGLLTFGLQVEQAKTTNDYGVEE